MMRETKEIQLEDTKESSARWLLETSFCQSYIFNTHLSEEETVFVTGRPQWQDVTAAHREAGKGGHGLASLRRRC